jgi:histidinol dehydrogenase
VKIITGGEFDSYWKAVLRAGADSVNRDVENTVREIIESVRIEGDAALRRYAAKFDKSSPAHVETALDEAMAAREDMLRGEPELFAALELSAGHIARFAQLQKNQLCDFEYEMEAGLFTGQRVVPVERAAIYVPAGRFPLFSSVLMGLIPALCAGVDEVILASPPMADGKPDRRILAAAAVALGSYRGRLRLFALGGAQAIAALALGTETVPRVDVIAGPGNKYVAAAKRLLFGETGIDFVAGPTDVLIIAEDEGGFSELAAADMLAQAEHDPDARARVLVPGGAMAKKIAAALEEQLKALPPESKAAARASLDAGGLIIVYSSLDEAVKIANTIAPEHLELHVKNSALIPRLKNYGSLFAGPLSAEVLGDYSAGINHTLPTSGSARFTGGLSVRHFLKTLTTLRVESAGGGYAAALAAAECMGRAEGLAAHAESAAMRRKYGT